jgi:hypothetical protein
MCISEPKTFDRRPRGAEVIETMLTLLLRFGTVNHD